VTLFFIIVGELDMQVSSNSANIFPISPKPKNITAISATNNQPSLVSLKLFSYLKTYIVEKLSSVTKSAFSIFSSKTNDTDPSTASVANTTTSDSAAAVPDNNTTPPLISEDDNQPKIDPQSPYAFITKDSWEATITPYTEPVHISIRSQQLQKVDFPIDHYSLLWCYELLSSVSFSMRQLVKQSSPSSSFQLHQIFALKNQEYIDAAIEEPSKLGISNLNNFILRNESNNDYEKMAVLDRMYLFKQVEGNYLKYMAILFVSKHLETIPLAIFSMTVLSFLSILCKYLFPNNNHNNNDDNNVKSITGFSLKDSIFNIQPFFTALSSGFYYLQHSHQLPPSSIISMVVVGIAIFVWRNPSYRVIKYDEWGSTCIASLIGILIHFLILCLIWIVRYIYYYYSQFLQLIGVDKVLLTIYQKLMGKDTKYIHSFMLEFVVFTLVLISISIQRQFLSIIWQSGFLLSSIIVWLNITNICRLLYQIIVAKEARTKNNSKQQKKKYNKQEKASIQLIDQLCDQMLPVLILGTITAIPSMFFAMNQIFPLQHSYLFESNLYHLFGVERINYFICILTMYWMIRVQYDMKM
jgi:hypothetical protein